MAMKEIAAKTVDEYISKYPQEIREKLKEIRKAILIAAPNATQRIAYRMPAFEQEGVLAFFAVFERHIGFYPLPSAIENFKERLSVYKSAKGSVQFPLDEEPPYDLITEMVAFRLKENLAKAAEKKGR